MHRSPLLPALVALLVAGILCAQEADQITALPLEPGAQLFVDDHLVASLRGLDWRLHQPVRREVAFVFDAPWEGPQTGYATVLRDPAGGYRLYYRGGGDVTTREVTCLAISEDGIRWLRPQLNLIEFEGTSSNNIIWTGRTAAYSESHNFSPFVDSNPAVISSERYKAVALMIGEDEAGDRHKMLGVLASADGIHWRRLSQTPVIRQGSFDSLNVALWDSNRHEYVCYARVGREGLRSIQRSTSPDFLQWSPPELLEFSPPQTEHFYTNATTLYSRSPGLYLGFPMRFVPERTAIGSTGREIDGTSDAVLISSRDGLHWDRTFRQAFLRPGLNPHSWGHAHGNNTIATGLLNTAPGEISLFWMENHGDVPRLRRGTLRTDGFTSLQAGAEPGEMVTKPLLLPGTHLTVNCSTSAVGSVRLEILDAIGQPLEGFTLEDCAEIFGDEIDRVVTWNGRSDLSSLQGIPVRLRFVLHDSDLHAFCVR